jgi:predicted Fe-Mo cluster-binding NifX family protein
MRQAVLLRVLRLVYSGRMLNGKALRIEGDEVSIREEGDSMMKIAVPSRDGLVDEHFGHCKEFLVFSVSSDGSLASEATIPSADGCGCKSDIASVLARAGVTHMVAGNMGEGAVRVLSSNGIAVVRGASGDARAAADAFAKGSLMDSGVGCAAHSEPGHDCVH